MLHFCLNYFVVLNFVVILKAALCGAAELYCSISHVIHVLILSTFVNVATQFSTTTN